MGGSVKGPFRRGVNGDASALRLFPIKPLQSVMVKSTRATGCAELNLTRRQSGSETWQVYYGDVRVGFIGKRSGVPVDADQWGWSAGIKSGELETGTAETFEAARRGFQEAWERLRPTVTPKMLDEWRRYTAFHAWMQKMKSSGLRLPTQNETGRARCFCGMELTTAEMEDHAFVVHRN